MFYLSIDNKILQDIECMMIVHVCQCSILEDKFYNKFVLQHFDMFLVDTFVEVDKYQGNSFQLHNCNMCYYHKARIVLNYIKYSLIVYMKRLRDIDDNEFHLPKNIHLSNNLFLLLFVNSLIQLGMVSTLMNLYYLLAYRYHEGMVGSSHVL